MSGGGPAAGVDSMGELLARAHRIEQEARERYGMLADQMDVHNNPALEKLFRDLAEIEGRHADEIAAQLAAQGLPQMGPLDFDWAGPESPEAIDPGDIHYRMTPWQALQLALAAERAALAFFEELAEAAGNPEIGAMAGEFAEEEAEHVRLVERELEKYPEPPETWDEDPDPPALQD